MPFNNMTEIKRANKAAGDHWFDPSTMRFFLSLIESETVKDGRYFVTSEKCPFGPGHVRAFTVREAHDYGTIGTVGEFQGHKSTREAWAWLKAEQRRGAI